MPRKRSYYSLERAISEADANDVIELIPGQITEKDSENAPMLVVPNCMTISKNLTIDLKGVTLKGNDAIIFEVDGSSEFTLQSENKATLKSGINNANATLTGISVVAGSSLKIDNVDFDFTDSEGAFSCKTLRFISNSGTANIQNSSMSGKATVNASDITGIKNTGTLTATNLAMNIVDNGKTGTVIGINNSGSSLSVKSSLIQIGRTSSTESSKTVGITASAGTLDFDNTTKVVISDSAENLSYGFVNSGTGSIEIPAASIKVTSGSDASACVYAEEGNVLVTNGYYAFEGNAGPFMKGTNKSLEARGGFYTGSVSNNYYYYQYETGDPRTIIYECAALNPTITEDGITYTHIIRERGNVATSSSVTDNGKPKAYPTLQEAIDATNDGGTVTLIADITSSTKLANEGIAQFNKGTLNNDYKVKFNLNGHNIRIIEDDPKDYIIFIEKSQVELYSVEVDANGAETDTLLNAEIKANTDVIHIGSADAKAALSIGSSTVHGDSHYTGTGVNRMHTHFPDNVHITSTGASKHDYAIKVGWEYDDDQKVHHVYGGTVNISGGCYYGRLYDESSTSVYNICGGYYSDHNVTLKNSQVHYIVPPRYCVDTPDEDEHKTNYSFTGESYPYTIDEISDSVTPNGPKIYGANIKISDDIQVNVYVKDYDSPVKVNNGNFYLVIKFGDGSEEKTLISDSQLVNVKVNGEKKQMYKISHAGVIPKEMTESISLTLTDSFGHIHHQVNNYSVSAYATNILGQSQDQKMKDLAVALKNYGGASQKYFSYKTDNLAYEGLTDAQKNFGMGYSNEEPIIKKFYESDDGEGNVMTDADIPSAKETSGETANVSSIGQSLIIGDKISIKYYFYVDDVDKYNASFMNKGTWRSRPLVADTEKAYSDGQKSNAYVTVQDITTTNFGTSYSVKVASKKNPEESPLTVKYSVNSYGHDMFGSTDSDLAHLVKTMFVVGERAKIYRDSQKTTQ